MNKFQIFKRVLPSIGPIIFRNVLLLSNAVIFSVVALLFIFGNKQAGIFLGIVVVFNTLLTVIQDVQSLIILENLQMLTALRVMRLNKDGSETDILAEEILKGDHLGLKLGDQVPCDGVLFSANNLEVSEALITGESDSFPRKQGEKLKAGDIITSGSGILIVENIFKESRISKISEDLKKYSLNPSFIQSATNKVIQYTGYILIAIIVFVVIHGLIVHQSKIEIVNNIGALASTIVPQGLMVFVTLLFAIGASSYSRRGILFQEINATEKLGRIKNLCMDKTGTLTDNILIVENMYAYDGVTKERVDSLVAAYVRGSGDSSQTILAVKNYLEKYNPKEGKIIKALSFSSWRQYGAVEVSSNDGTEVVFVGTPDVFLSHISSKEEQDWLKVLLKKYSQTGKRILCVARGEAADLQRDLSGSNLSILGIFVFGNTFRKGIENSIKFFQDRGVKIRIISGDNPDTVSAIAMSLGINDSDTVVTGDVMSKWSDSDFNRHAHEYAIFAQILPEQKVRLIEAFKKDGFTAMVGDGVNDALAMKKADLGIAMFDGVPVTRQLAGVVLMNNSFSDLPGAVELADNFIRSIEISAGIYINQSLLGLFFFVIISFFGFSYPLMPLNITIINDFTVGFIGVFILYWAIRPTQKVITVNDKPFLKRVLPFIVTCSIIEAIGTAFVFALSPSYLKSASSNTLVLFSFIIFGFLFFILATKLYSGSITKKQKFHIFILGVFEFVLFSLLLKSTLLVNFFNITVPYPPSVFITKTLIVISIFGCLQYLAMKLFFTIGNLSNK